MVAQRGDAQLCPVVGAGLLDGVLQAGPVGLPGDVEFLAGPLVEVLVLRGATNQCVDGGLVGQAEVGTDSSQRVLLEVAAGAGRGGFGGPDAFDDRSQRWCCGVPETTEAYSSQAGPACSAAAARARSKSSARIRPASVKVGSSVSFSLAQLRSPVSRSAGSAPASTGRRWLNRPPIWYQSHLACGLIQYVSPSSSRRCAMSRFSSNGPAVGRPQWSSRRRPQRRGPRSY
ncbi:hypothetical protein [Haloechinothrix halophila]|uniref:hypothetical protein n=1 Tax=Haloechinothrix halophila TaxID=1069073 RepID=UPI000555219C|nr:hypothetical protein [Haloechinothrix halophila]